MGQSSDNSSVSEVNATGMGNTTGNKNGVESINVRSEKNTCS